MDNQVEKLIIIGSGPAGLSAAIYAARGGLNPLVIAGRGAGGQLMLTTDVDDFPGFPEGIQGPDLMAKMRAQAERFDTRFINEDVVSVDFSTKPFKVQAESRQLLAESIIIATGASAQWLGLPSEQNFIGRGVSACAVCDGLFFKDKDLIVVGGGDTAMREAQHLAKLAKTVTVIHRRDVFRAQDALISLVKSKPNVKFMMNTELVEVLGDQKVTAAKLRSTSNDPPAGGPATSNEIPIDGIFIAIGHKPNTDFLKGQLELDEHSYVKFHDLTKTSVEGVFVAGDVSDQRYRQGVTAAGVGAAAALDAEWYLETLRSNGK